MDETTSSINSLIIRVRLLTVITGVDKVIITCIKGYNIQSQRVDLFMPNLTLLSLILCVKLLCPCCYPHFLSAANIISCYSM